MSIKVTFEFDTPEAAAAFLLGDDAPESSGEKPAGKKRGRPAGSAAAPAAVPAAAAPAAAPLAAAPPATASAPAVPFKAVADTITELAQKDMDTAKAVLAKFGVAKASDLKPEQFAAFVEAAKAALNPPAPAATSLI